MSLSQFCLPVRHIHYQALCYDKALELHTNSTTAINNKKIARNKNRKIVKGLINSGSGNEPTYQRQI
jgi:hypothetical protein